MRKSWLSKVGYHQFNVPRPLIKLIELLIIINIIWHFQLVNSNIIITDFKVIC